MKEPRGTSFDFRQREFVLSQQRAIVRVRKASYVEINPFSHHSRDFENGLLETKGMCEGVTYVSNL